MKFLLFLVTVTLLSSCVQKENSATSSDSVSVDTTTFIDESDSTLANPSDAPEIYSALTKLVDEQEKTSAKQHSLLLSASGDDYSTEEVWRFDSLHNLVYCYQDWSSEGIDGKTHHFFRQERLYAIQDEHTEKDKKDVRVYHNELGGVSFTLAGSEIQSSSAKPLKKKFLIESEQDLKDRLSEIARLLKTNQKDILKGNPARLKVENESQTPEGRTKETTMITIDRKLLDVVAR
jgi:hypothetical protein